jgi:SAM-dependent methyltransferase
MPDRDLIETREQAEIQRSLAQALRTPDHALRVSAATFARYARPTKDSAYPLEYAFFLLGDVQGRRIVDFGCGTGGNSIMLTNRGAQVWGVDISVDLLRLAQRRLAVNNRAGATFIACSAHALPFPDASIDVVFGMAILHHLDLGLASREVHRVLKRGGRAIFKEPTRNSHVIRFVRSLVPYHPPDISPYERPLSDREIEQFASGFSQRSIKAFALPHLQVGKVLRVPQKPLYEWDRRLLDRLPWLTRYASVQVIDLVK